MKYSKVKVYCQPLKFLFPISNVMTLESLSLRKKRKYAAYLELCSTLLLVRSSSDFYKNLHMLILILISVSRNPSLLISTEEDPDISISGSCFLF